MEATHLATGFALLFAKAVGPHGIKYVFHLLPLHEGSPV